MFRIFIEEAILKQVIDSESQKPKASRSYLYKVMRLLKTLYVSADEPDNGWAEHLKQLHGISVDYSKSDYIKGVKEYPEMVLQNPSSLFILDIPIVDANNIRTSYGVLCINGENPNIAQLIDTNNEHTTDDNEPLGNGWSTVLKSVRNLPSNALLLTDRYLFSGYSQKAGNGIDNVRSILDTLLPEKFIGEYHVTIVFDNESKNVKYTSFKEIATQLNKVKQGLHRDYPINMEVLGITPDCDLYNELHNRRIISNYYIIKVEHKLAAFNGNRGTCMQTITPQTLFTIDSLNRNSTPPLKAIDHAIADIRNFSLSVSKTDDSSDYYYALNGKLMEKCTGIKNRLLK